MWITACTVLSRENYYHKILIQENVLLVCKRAGLPVQLKWNNQMVGDDVREVMCDRSCKTLQAIIKNLAYTLMEKQNQSFQHGDNNIYLKFKDITLPSVSSEGKKHLRVYVSGADVKRWQNLTRMAIVEVVESTPIGNVF